MRIDMQSARTRKRFFAGTHRSVAPEETWTRIAPLLPRFGITRVADITGLDRIGLPVAVAVRPLSRSLVVAAGKGATLAAAKVSAAMESLECAHAEAIRLPLRYASRTELTACGSVAAIADLPRLRGALPDEHTRLVWIEGRSIGDGRPIMVPYELVHAHYVAHGLAGTGIFQATTNGLSSGNSFAEAVSHGLFEVVERDALNLWERGLSGHREPRRLDLSLAGAPEAVRMAETLAAKGFGLAIWDIRSDIGVPAFHCIIVDEADPAGHPGTGTGCHPDAAVALGRAISEAVQVRGTYISGGRDDLLRRDYDPSGFRSFRRHVDAGADATVAFTDIESRLNPDFEDDIEWVAGRIEAVGCGPVIVVDLSLPDTGIHVVRVVVPGLEGPSGAELAPGRRARGVRP